MNSLDSLLSKSVTPSEWSNQIINRQQRDPNSLVDHTDMVKEAICAIQQHLRQDGIMGAHELNQSTDPSHMLLREARTALWNYLQSSLWKPSSEEPLKGTQLKEAVKDLCVDTTSYAKCDRKLADPPINGQHYALYSFNPSKGSFADTNGNYGFFKVRGVYGRKEEAIEKCEELIQYFSANQIFICEVGKPMPLTHEMKDRNNVTEIGPPKNTEEKAADNHNKYTKLVNDLTLQEKKEKEEILKRSELLLEDVKKDPNDVDPLQRYIQLRIKRASSAYFYVKSQREIERLKVNIREARKQLAEMEEEHPNLVNEYKEHYDNTIKERGINKATDEMALYIKEYVNKDPDLGF